MKNYVVSSLLLMSATIALSSCREASKLPEPKNESIPLIIPEINPAKSFFHFRRSQLSEKIRLDSLSLRPNYYVRPEFEFIVNPSQGYAELQTVEVYKSFRRGTSTITFGPRVKVRDVTSFPATVTISSQEAITDLFPNAGASPSPIRAPTTSPAQNNRILPGDAVVFTFEYILKDGRRIVLTPVSTTPGFKDVMLASAQVNAPLAAIAFFRVP